MWEYMETACPVGQQINTANAYGQDGWELVSMVGITIAASPLLPQQAQPGFLLVFKRKVTSDHKNGTERRDIIPDTVGISQAR